MSGVCRVMCGLYRDCTGFRDLTPTRTKNHMDKGWEMAGTLGLSSGVERIGLPKKRAPLLKVLTIRTILYRFFILEPHTLGICPVYIILISSYWAMSLNPTP